MSNAYVFEGSPAEGSDQPVEPTDRSDGPSPVSFILLLITALVLAAVIILLLVRCCGGSDAPEIALTAIATGRDTVGGLR